MQIKFAKFFALMLAAMMVFCVVAGCQPQNPTGGDQQTNPPATDTPSDPNAGTDPVAPVEVNYEDVDENDAIVHQDFTSVYKKIGSKITIDMVEEDEDGIATVTYEGKTYELGIDFLSMAMVYNATTEDEYNQWWMAYIERWNQLVPDIPLYSNYYYDVYNANIENFVTSPFFGPANAILYANIKGY